MSPRFSFPFTVVASISLVLAPLLAVAADIPPKPVALDRQAQPAPAIQAAVKVDSLLRQEVPFAKAAPKKIGDELFLRRASLDLIGRLPTPEEVTAFVLDPTTDKRSKIVTKLLADPR